MNSREIFSIRGQSYFEKKALEVFKIQAEKNAVYRQYIETLGLHPQKIKSVQHIPFLPIGFFKTHEVVTGPKASGPAYRTFLSSGTTGSERSKHHVADISIYEKSFRKCFELFYGSPSKYAILAVLPSYYENKSSSLLYMAMDLIAATKNKHSAFYNHRDENLARTLKTLLATKQKVILLGVSFALLDLLPFLLPGTNANGLIMMETGGMKGRREELTREELHKALCEKSGVKKIHSEYGMTELLSQAYSKGSGVFTCPPWMKVVARDVNDPLQVLPGGQAGALNIIDLANIHSCSFIATDDVGMVNKDNTFTVLGRLDNTDLRGCNLLVA